MSKNLRIPDGLTLRTRCASTSRLSVSMDEYAPSCIRLEAQDGKHLYYLLPYASGSLQRYSETLSHLSTGTKGQIMLRSSAWKSIGSIFMVTTVREMQ